MYLSKDRLAPEAGLYRAVDDSKECEELNPEEATSEKTVAPVTTCLCRSISSSSSGRHVF